jgi:hypothetical protein
MFISAGVGILELPATPVLRVVLRIKRLQSMLFKDNISTAEDDNDNEIDDLERLGCKGSWYISR